MKQKQIKPLQGSPRNLLIGIVLAVLTLFILTRLADTMREDTGITYSEFIQKAELGDVKMVRIVPGKYAHGELSGGKRFHVILPSHDTRNLENILINQKIAFTYDQSDDSMGSWFMVLMAVLMIFGLIGAAVYFMTQNKGGGNNSGGGGIFSMGKSRAKVFMPSQIKVNFEDVAGAKDAKEELRDVIDFLKNPDKYRKLGAKLPRGILLVGEPGNGKTLLAKAAAGEANCPFFNISGSEFIEVFVGVGAARIRDLFAQARRSAPAIIFIDEIDAIGRQRGSGLGGGHDEREQALNQLLIEMDGFETSQLPLIVIAATNMPEVLDKALLRPGRFDRLITVPFPDLYAREQIFGVHTRSIKLAEDVDVKKIAEDTAGLSGADIANLVNQAALSASRRGDDCVRKVDFESAFIKIRESQKASDNQGQMPSTNAGMTASRARMYTPTQVKTRFESVAGNDEAKEELADIVDFLKNPEKYKRIGAKIPRGVLMIGEPGNGKTLMAKALAGEASCPFFSVSGSEFVEMYVGVGAARVRDLFAQARRHAPCIIFIDEIDALGGSRGDFGNRESDQTLNQLLTEMDGFDQSHDPIVVIGATNRVDALDKALLRPGRFDRKVHVTYPDINSREKILKLHAANARVSDSVDMRVIARATPHFSGADLANLVNEAVLIAAKDNREDATMADFDEARDKIIMGKQNKTMVRQPEELRLTAYHEAGHALVALLKPELLDPLYKVTILARGGALGVTHSLPEVDKHSYSKEEFLAKIMMCLGGRIAEEIVFGKISTGASNDFEHATTLARNMVCSYGMSSLGPMIYDVSRGGKLSDQTAFLVDQEIRKILEECYAKTVNLLTENRDKLEKLAEALLEHEEMDADQVYVLLGITPRTSHKIA